MPGPIRPPCSAAGPTAALMESPSASPRALLNWARLISSSWRMSNLASAERLRVAVPALPLDCTSLPRRLRAGGDPALVHRGTGWDDAGAADYRFCGLDAARQPGAGAARYGRAGLHRGCAAIGGGAAVSRRAHGGGAVAAAGAAAAARVRGVSARTARVDGVWEMTGRGLWRCF